MNRTTQFPIAPLSTVVPQSPISVERSMTVKGAKSKETFKSGLGFPHTFKMPEAPPRLEFTDTSMNDGIELKETHVLIFGGCFAIMDSCT